MEEIINAAIVSTVIILGMLIIAIVIDIINRFLDK